MRFKIPLMAMEKYLQHLIQCLSIETSLKWTYKIYQKSFMETSVIHHTYLETPIYGEYRSIF